MRPCPKTQTTCVFACIQTQEMGVECPVLLHAQLLAMTRPAARSRVLTFFIVPILVPGAGPRLSDHRPSHPALRPALPSHWFPCPRDPFPEVSGRSDTDVRGVSEGQAGGPLHLRRLGPGRRLP
jgi:hypothetical protein